MDSALQTGNQVNPPYSEETARAIDAEIQRLTSEAYASATDILEQRRDALNAVTEYLIKHESMPSEILSQLIQNPIPAPLPMANTRADPQETPPQDQRLSRGVP